MVLVDTSVLINFFKDNQNEQTKKLDEIIELKIPFGITDHIYQEVLQGSASQDDFNKLKKYLDTLIFYRPKHEKESYSEAARIYFLCKKKSVTIRSTIDCLIVQIARENGVRLLHRDKDFTAICKVVKGVEFY